MTDGTRKRLTGVERRKQLIEVGRSVFADVGYEAASVEEIAEKAGISKPVVYEHFGGKEGLYAVVIDREMEHVIARISEAISTGSARERLDGAVYAFMEYVQARPDGFAVLFRDSPANSDMENLLAEVALQVSEVFVAEFESAGYAPESAPIYAQALIGMVSFVGKWWQDNPNLSADVIAHHLSGLAWMGLRHLPRVDVSGAGNS